MKMPSNAIAQGAGFAAVAFVTALLCRYVPMVMVLYLLLPVGMVLLAGRFRFRVALISGIIPAAATFLIFDWTTAIDYAVYLVLVGGVMSFVYAKNTKGWFKLAAGYVAVLAAMLIMIAVYQQTTGTGFAEGIVENVRATMTEALTTAGMTNAQTTKTVVDQVVSSISLAIPSMVLIVPFFAAWILVLLSDTVMRNRGMTNAALPPLSHWIMPRSTARFLLLLLIVVFIADLSGNMNNVYMVALSALTDLAYGMMGLSFLFWVFNRRRPRESTGVKIAILVIVAITYAVSLQILPLIGIVDVYSRLRLHITMRDKRR